LAITLPFETLGFEHLVGLERFLATTLFTI
jgi:hypothetical protein